MQENFVKAIEKLNNWIESNGWVGYDPYDLKEMKWVRNITDYENKNILKEVFRESIFELFSTFPILSRKIFRVTPRMNAKAMGLFSRAYLDLHLYSNDEKYLKKSSECLFWLENNCSNDNEGMSWGYPFDWQSKKLISGNTPNGIVTTAVGDAFWAWYKFTQDKRYLDICKKICNFLVSLPQDKVKDDLLCFSYTPLFVNHIHNLNLFVAEFLLKVGMETQNNTWSDLARRAVNYTISDQLTDGSFDYNGPPENHRDFVDNYHTGFVLRMLYSIYKLTDDPSVSNALNKCYSHYKNSFFENDEIPKLLPDRKYRIDIHSCAESINCLSELSSQFNDALALANRIALWTIKNLQDEQGYFYYGILKNRPFGMTYKSKIAYIRWGQAWMLKALSNLVCKNEAIIFQ